MFVLVTDVKFVDGPEDISENLLYVEFVFEN